MRLRQVYLLLCVAGAIVPMLQFAPWVAEHGLNVPALFAELFSTRIGAFFGLDVIVSAMVLAVFASAERAQVRWWWVSLAATFVVGVSLGLPLLLYLREIARERA